MRTQQEELDSILPVWMVKARQREERKEVDKPCKYHLHGYPCYEELKWGYCGYLHADELRRAFVRAGTRGVTTAEILAELGSGEHVDFLKRLLRFAPEPPSREELFNVRFELERSKHQRENQAQGKPSFKEQAKYYRWSKKHQDAAE